MVIRSRRRRDGGHRRVCRRGGVRQGRRGCRRQGSAVIVSIRTAGSGTDKSLCSGGRALRLRVPPSFSRIQRQADIEPETGQNPVSPLEFNHGWRHYGRPTYTTHGPGAKGKGRRYQEPD